MPRSTATPAHVKTLSPLVDGGGHLMGIASSVYLAIFWSFVYFNVDFDTFQLRDHAYDSAFVKLQWCLPIHVFFSLVATLKSYWWLPVMAGTLGSLVFVFMRWMGY